MAWPAAEILDAARKGEFELFTSVALLTELEELLGRAKRLAIADITPRELVLGYAAVAAPVTPLAIPAVILVNDPDDDAVLACALAAQAEDSFWRRRLVELEELSGYRHSYCS